MENINYEPKGRADHIDQLVSRRLKTRRMILGLSQQELSEAVDVSIQQVQKYEKAINRISSGKLYAFAKFLDVPVNYFFQEDVEDSALNFLAEEAQEYAQEDRGSLPSEKEILSLVRLFSGIKVPQVRKKILELIRAVSQ